MRIHSPVGYLVAAAALAALIKSAPDLRRYLRMRRM
jgi:hypothetical protein